VADTARCSHSFPACSRVLGTELVGVCAAVPAVPSVPMQIAEVSKKLVKPPASRSRSGIMHPLMGEFDRRLPRPRRSPLGCDGLMVCSPRLGDLLFVSLMGSYIWHHAALDQFRALNGVAMERGGVRRALSHTVRIRNSGRMAWSPNQLRRAKPALESEKEVGSSEFGADFAQWGSCLSTVATTCCVSRLFYWLLKAETSLAALRRHFPANDRRAFPGGVIFCG